MKKRIDWKNKKDMSHTLGRIVEKPNGERVFQLYGERKNPIPAGFSPYWIR